MIELVGITGPARHGKDTVAKMILEVCPGFTRFAFADKMKEMSTACFRAEHPDDGAEWKEGEQKFTLDFISMVNYLEGPNFGASWKLFEPCAKLAECLERLTPDYQEDQEDCVTATFTGSWRLIYQILGTDWGRAQDEDLWVDFLPLDKPTIVTDVRGHGDRIDYNQRNNEALKVKEAGGIVIEVVDPRKGSVVRAHASEAGIVSGLISYTIVNDGSLEDLRKKVKDFIYIWLMSDL